MVDAVRDERSLQELLGLCIVCVTEQQQPNGYSTIPQNANCAQKGKRACPFREASAIDQVILLLWSMAFGKKLKIREVVQNELPAFPDAREWPKRPRISRDHGVQKARGQPLDCGNQATHCGPPSRWKVRFRQHHRGEI